MILGVTCCLGAAALYLLSRSSGRDAEVLKTVTRVGQLEELAQLLDVENKILPSIVAASGRVGSETPIKCEHSGLLGVIFEETAEQHFLKRNWTWSWVKDTASMLSMSKEVPWYLDDGTGRVHVVGARGATGFALTVGGEVFEESRRSLVRGTLDYLRGLKMLGVKRIERVLPTGMPLTVVGEAIKADVGTVRIQKPDGGPFYISHKSLDQLISNLGKSSRWYKYASVGLTVFGVFLIAKHAIEDVLERKRQWELLNSDKRNGCPIDENDSDSTRKEHEVSNLCVICLEREYNVAFVLCGHMCCCLTCSSRLTTCPLCRSEIFLVLKTYRP